MAISILQKIKTKRASASVDYFGFEPSARSSFLNV
jgi:hypothetical protein